MSARFKKWLRRFLVACVLLLAMTAAINLYIIRSTRNQICSEIRSLPQREFALLLGTEPVRPDGTTNLHFLNRTDAAARIYQAEKVTALLISGSKNNRGFNEVLEMKNRIVTNGVPESALQLDFEGSRTWESVRRARDVYHLQKIIVVTDAFHAPRALFLCRHFGIEAVAYCPGKVPFGYWSVRYQVKEYFARLIAVFDILTESKHGQNG
ncbi:MAG TPA: ElyC/SanA/YdcF family protein [Candidatus Acidoferrales bacterium]|jgi:SanA protein|nr:ElyC/SanA/YdcF family protein [Candidatus Acidoferrales bacterium]